MAKTTKYAGTQTEKNLQAAFAGESQARSKYTFFASVAKKQGYEQIAALFLKTADNEKEHAKLWFKELAGIGRHGREPRSAPQRARTTSGRTCMQALPRRPRQRASRSWPPVSAWSAEVEASSRGALSRPAAQCGDGRRLRKERGQGLGVPQLRPHRRRHGRSGGLSRLRPSAELF